LRIKQYVLVEVVACKLLSTSLHSTLEYLFCIATFYADVVIAFEIQDRFLLNLASNTEFARYTSAFPLFKHQVPVFDLIANKACLVLEKTFSTYFLLGIELVAVEFCVTFRALVTLPATRKIVLLLVSRYTVLEFMFLLWVVAYSARNSARNIANHHHPHHKAPGLANRSCRKNCNDSGRSSETPW
jgi:hypothetical protein